MTSNQVNPEYSEYARLAQDGKAVLLWRDIPADLETPTSLYLKLRKGKSFLLESVENSDQVGRYSFIGIDVPREVRVIDGQPTLCENGVSTQLPTANEDPIAALRPVLAERKVTPFTDSTPFRGGAVGFVGYDCVRFFEPIPMPEADELHLPDAAFLLADTFIVFDHAYRRARVVAVPDPKLDSRDSYDEATERIQALVSRMATPLPDGNGSAHTERGETVCGTTQEEYETAVLAAKEYIAAGDAFQIVLSQRLSRQTTVDSFRIYRALRMLNPSPYTFFLEFGDFDLIGSSPERLASLRDGWTETNPIAGTRPRGTDATDDERLAEELATDTKERAEHLMLVDLGRNDIGRVSEPRTVAVPTLMRVDRFSHVMHLVSRVIGKLRPGLDALDLLRAVFPAGTLSGAPKVRAMQIISELEGIRRGPYGGAVGYFGYDGNMDMCITIRTIVRQGHQAHMQAGAGIVADSVPKYEYRECLNKLRALDRAIDLAENGGL